MTHFAPGRVLKFVEGMVVQSKQVEIEVAQVLKVKRGRRDLEGRPPMSWRL